jgi:hypothetical protein
MNTFTLSLVRIERALHDDLVKAIGYGRRPWVVRKNGRTRTWKTRPGQFSIPVKIGLSKYDRITEKTTFSLLEDNGGGDFQLSDFPTLPPKEER